MALKYTAGTFVWPRFVVFAIIFDKIFELFFCKCCWTMKIIVFSQRLPPLFPTDGSKSTIVQFEVSSHVRYTRFFSFRSCLFAVFFSTKNSIFECFHIACVLRHRWRCVESVGYWQAAFWNRVWRTQRTNYKHSKHRWFAFFSLIFSLISNGFCMCV